MLNYLGVCTFKRVVEAQKTRFGSPRKVSNQNIFARDSGLKELRREFASSVSGPAVMMSHLKVLLITLGKGTNLRGQV